MVGTKPINHFREVTKMIKEDESMMQVHEIGLSYLVEYENNPRNNDSGVEAVAASIKEFGFKVFDYGCYAGLFEGWI